MRFSELIGSFPGETTLTARPRPYINHSVEFKGVFNVKDRAEMLEAVGLNVFFFPSEMITGCDFLSDSGTTSMTNEQWAALHLGDEAYGSNRGYFLLMEQVRELFGEVFFNKPDARRPNAFIFHQGRAAEDALFSLLGKTGSGMIIPSNGHFDTTMANIEANQIQAINLFSPEIKRGNPDFRFKGNMDLERLEQMLEREGEKVPLVYLTVTNNTAAGQPVSLENINHTARIAHRFGKPLFLDACRFAENAWFIQKYESSYRDLSIRDIVREMFAPVDGFTISFKKDGLVNMGGGLFLRDNGLFIENYPEIPDALVNYQVTKEGHPTYGGLSGRDIMALYVGLKTVTRDDYLTYRIQQVQRFGERMAGLGLPVLTPVGGHAVYLDVNRFFEGTSMQAQDFGGIAFTAVLLAAYGHRACELGYFAFGKMDPQTGKDLFPEINFVRFAVPRLRYEQDDLESVAEAVKILHRHRDIIPAVNVTYGRNLPIRHFKARFEFRK
ncbi:tryptophanase [bacterium]|nr:tryptophanase [bacterium]